MRSLLQKLLLFKNVKILQFIYLNYFCKSVQRTGKGRIIPYKYAVIDLEEGSKIVIGDGNLRIGTDQLHGSKAETYLRLREKARWDAIGGCSILYGATLEVLQNAIFSSGFFTMNSGSVLIAAKRIQLGNDVMIARNVVIYDSDFHALGAETDVSAAPVVIGDHVWIATNAMILKGVSIGAGSVIAANTLVSGNVKEQVLVGQKIEEVVLREHVEWRR